MNNPKKESLERIKDYPRVEIDFIPNREHKKNTRKTLINVRYA
jgi:hypothetical protein